MMDRDMQSLQQLARMIQIRKKLSRNRTNFMYVIHHTLQIINHFPDFFEKLRLFRQFLLKEFFENVYFQKISKNMDIHSFENIVLENKLPLSF